MFEPETVWTFDSADRISFGIGAADELGDELSAFDASNVLFVSDSGVVDAGIVAYLIDRLPEGMAYEVYGDVEPEPDIDVYRSALERARAVSPEVIVGVGGGSAMDVAKTTGVLVEAGGDPLEYVSPPIGAGKRVSGPGRPVVCLPTTAGTGAETSPATVISLPDREIKVGISNRYQYPDLALLDPRLTITLPPEQTASSGMDALAQAIEAYTVRRYDEKQRADTPASRPDYGGRTPITDSLAEQAIELLSDNIRRAVGNGEDIQARSGMLMGSLLAGLAYTNAGVTINHAMAMAIGGMLHSPHGATVSILLPASMRYNAAAVPDRHTIIADLLADGTERTTATGSEGAADIIERLRSDLGLPDGLSDFGASDDDVRSFAERTIQLERLTAGNPRDPSIADIEGLIERSL